MNRLFLPLIAALAAVLLIVPRGYANGYGYGYNYAPVVVVPTVVTVPTPVALFTYAAPVTTPAPVVLSASLLESQQNETAQLREQVAQLRRQVAQLRKLRASPTVSGPPVIADLASGVTPPGTPETNGPPQALSAPVNREALLARAAQIATNHCSMCHSGQVARGDVSLFDAAGVFNPNVGFDEIYQAVSRKQRQMPKNREKLSADEQAVFRELRDAAE